MVFAAHGNISVERIGRIIINRPTTAFNSEGMQALFKSIAAQAVELEQGGWILVESLGNEALPTPSAIDELLASYRRCKNLGCKKIAGIGNPLQREFLGKAASNAGLPIAFYNDEKAAINANCAFSDS